MALVMCMGGTVNVLAAANKDLEIEVNGKVVEAPGKVLEANYVKFRKEFLQKSI